MKDKLIGLFLLLMGLTWAVMGGSELKENLANKTPMALTWPQFLEQKPKAGWFKVTGAQLDVAGAIYIENLITGEMGNVYVPAHAQDAEFDETTPIEMLVKVDDAKILATVKELKELDKGTDEAALKYVLSHANELTIERPFVGTLADGFDAVDSDEESAIKGAGAALATDFVILQENAKPDFGGRLFMVVGGIGLCLLGLFYIFLKKPAPPAPTTASDSPPLSQ